MKQTHRKPFGPAPGRPAFTAVSAYPRSELLGRLWTVSAVGGRPLDRVMLEAISFEHLDRKGGTEYH
jgi:hypothetical protein